MTNQSFDILVVGAGIAGASISALLAQRSRVALLERESLAGYHSTGRSAAMFSETYGNAVVRALTRASRDFLYAPPAGFTDYPLVRQRGWLHIAREDQLSCLDDYFALPDVAARARSLNGSEVCKLSPLLRPDYAEAGIYEPDASDVDVNALHQGYLKMVRAAGGQLILDAPVRHLDRVRDVWRVDTPAGSFEAPIVINAAGAWADELAALAGAAQLGIVPNRRTAVLVDAPANDGLSEMPVTIDIEEQFYFKPDSGQLLLSPADETPSPPCDVQPDEMDVAIAVDRVQAATTLEIRRVRRKWAGLRNFAPDRCPVIGYDPRVEHFFWLAGQGGYGIQTAPGVARLAAALVRDENIPVDLVGFGVDPDAVSPLRLDPVR